VKTLEPGGCLAVKATRPSPNVNPLRDLGRIFAAAARSANRRKVDKRYVGRLIS
jgi:hypothetical protein